MLMTKVQALCFPGGSVVKSPPAEVGDVGSIPDLGRSHVPQSTKARAPKLPSLCSRAGGLQLLSPHATMTDAFMPQSLCSATGEATATRSPHAARRSSPRSPQVGKSLCSNKDPAQPEINK